MRRQCWKLGCFLISALNRFCCDPPGWQIRAAFCNMCFLWLEMWLFLGTQRLRLRPGAWRALNRVRGNGTATIATAAASWCTGRLTKGSWSTRSALGTALGILFFWGGFLPAAGSRAFVFSWAGVAEPHSCRSQWAHLLKNQLRAKWVLY